MDGPAQESLMYIKDHDIQCALSTIAFTEFNYSISMYRDGR